jgi:hypothetical protein
MRSMNPSSDCSRRDFDDDKESFSDH